MQATRAIRLLQSPKSGREEARIVAGTVGGRSGARPLGPADG